MKDAGLRGQKRDYMLFSHTFSPINQIPTNARIAAAIRKGILSGEFKSGQKLTLSMLVDLFGGFRTPIREALIILEDQGFIEHPYNKIIRVAHIDSKFIQDTYAIRLLLECEAIRKCCISDHFDGSMLQKKQADAEANIEQYSADQYIDYDLFFHSEIWRQSENHKLYSFITQVWSGPYVGNQERQVDLWKVAMLEHREILEGILRHDYERAEKAITMQIDRSCKRMVAAMKMHGGEQG